MLKYLLYIVDPQASNYIYSFEKSNVQKFLVRETSSEKVVKIFATKTWLFPASNSTDNAGNNQKFYVAYTIDAIKISI